MRHNRDISFLSIQIASAIQGERISYVRVEGNKKMPESGIVKKE